MPITRHFFQRCMIFLLFFAMGIRHVYAQVPILTSTLNKFAKDYKSEAVYIQYDRSIYSAGDTIWFKAYLMSNMQPSGVSKTFYMDWTDDSGHIIAHNSYPIAFGSTHGQFEIPQDYADRQLHVQAYTKWILNFDHSFLYRKNIHVETIAGTVNNNTPLKDTIYFFPEGGDMIAGLRNKIAFKAVSNKRVSVAVSGYIENSSGKTIDSFQSRHDGMGYFYLQPKAGEKYVVKWKDESHQLHHSSLPPARLSGVSMQIQSNSGERKFIIQRTVNAGKSFRKLHIIATQQQQLVFEADLHLEGHTKAEASVPVSELPSGILRFTLFDENWLPIAERITFVNNGEYIFSPHIRLDTISFEKRGLNVLSIVVPDSLTANLSIAITDADIGQTDSSDNIISHLFLTSELKGGIYNPAYYFKDNSLQAQEDLDLVMLTNGWRKYNWHKILQGEYPDLKYSRDSAYLYFSGRIENIPKSVKKVITDDSKHLLIFSLRPLHDTLSRFLPLPLDSNGRFGKPGLLVFDSLVVGYQFSDKKINLRSPAIDFMPGRIDKAVATLLQSRVELSDAEAISEPLSGMAQQIPKEGITSKKGIRLKAVKVTAKAKTPAEVLEDRYTKSALFKNTFGYNIDVQDDKNAALSLNILTYLQMKVPGLKISSAGNVLAPPKIEWSAERSIIPGTGYVPPNIYFNEFKVDADMILKIPVSEIAYVKVFGPPFVGDLGGAIAIYTKKGKDYYHSLPTKLKQRIIEGYSVIKEFYSPDYSTVRDNSTTDTRTTLFWDPMIIINPNSGPVKIRFYNNDDSNSYRVILEGMTKAGKLTKVEKLINYYSK